jgi:CBS domain-containing protein
MQPWNDRRDEEQAISNVDFSAFDLTHENLSYILQQPIENMVSTDILILGSDKSVADATSLMKDKNARITVVMHYGEMVGIITKKDILFKVIAQGRSPTKVKLREIMSTPVIAISPKTRIADVLKVMDRNIVRQVIVSSGSVVVGMITLEEMFDRIQKAALSTSTTAISGTPVCLINPKAIVLVRENTGVVSCPYCNSPYDEKEALSKHIDRIHGGSGVLEGDTRRMFE